MDFEKIFYELKMNYLIDIRIQVKHLTLILLKLMNFMRAMLLLILSMTLIMLVFY